MEIEQSAPNGGKRTGCLLPFLVSGAFLLASFVLFVIKPPMLFQSPKKDFVAADFLDTIPLEASVKKHCKLSSIEFLEEAPEISPIPQYDLRQSILRDFLVQCKIYASNIPSEANNKIVIQFYNQAPKANNALPPIHYLIYVNSQKVWDSKNEDNDYFANKKGSFFNIAAHLSGFDTNVSEKTLFKRFCRLGLNGRSLNLNIREIPEFKGARSVAQFYEGKFCISKRTYEEIDCGEEDFDAASMVHSAEFMPDLFRNNNESGASEPIGFLYPVTRNTNLGLSKFWIEEGWGDLKSINPQLTNVLSVCKNAEHEEIVKSLNIERGKDESRYEGSSYIKCPNLHEPLIFLGKSYVHGNPETGYGSNSGDFTFRYKIFTTVADGKTYTVGKADLSNVWFIYGFNYTCYSAITKSE